MSDPNVPGGPAPDTTPTEALPLADQQPVAAPTAVAQADAPPAPKGGHTRTILEVVGGVVAAGLIVVAGLVGFAVGHATGNDGGDRAGHRGWAEGPEAGQRLPGQGLPGQDGFGPGLDGGPGHRDGDRDGAGRRGDGPMLDGPMGGGFDDDGPMFDGPMGGELAPPPAPNGG